MVLYRRNKTPGGIYFFTVTLKNRKSDLLTRHVEVLKTAMGEIKLLHPYNTLAFVILPEHLHTIWKLPENDFNYSDRWRKIKTIFTKRIIKIERYI